MIQKGLPVGVGFSMLVLGALAVTSGAVSASPIAPIPVVQDAAVSHKVTFWGRPFPYQYKWSLVRACTRYIPVETARGPRMERVWVCRERARRYR